MESAVGDLAFAASWVLLDRATMQSVHLDAAASQTALEDVPGFEPCLKDVGVSIQPRGGGR